MKNEDENLLEKVNKLSLPATILIGCIILGGFYFFTESSKQKSIERQQQAKFAEEKKINDDKATKEAYDSLTRSSCVDEAEQLAQEQYKKTCTYECKEGYYYNANYKSYYDICLQRSGL